jgi:hypothetical protein
MFEQRPNLVNFDAKIKNTMAPTKSYLEINFTAKDNLHELIYRRTDLPYKCKFKIFDSSDSSKLIYASKRREGWRYTGSGNPESQYISTYFRATGSSTSNIPRWTIIQDEMNKYKIAEATLYIEAV